MSEAKAKWIVGIRMESTAVFEKKVSLTPLDLNTLKDVPIEQILLKKSKDLVENKCSEHGFVLPGSLKILSRSMGYFEPARFTGDAVYYVKLEGKVIYPADGIRVMGEVIRKNKMGLYVEYQQAIRIQVPRDLHIGNLDFDAVEIGDKVEVELKRSKFQINDPYILASGVFISAYQPRTPEGSPPRTPNSYSPHTPEGSPPRTPDSYSPHTPEGSPPRSSELQYGGNEEEEHDEEEDNDDEKEDNE